MTGLLIVSDVQIFREGLAIALSRKGMYDVVQAGSRPGEALRAARRKKPRVALIDQMMDGCCTVMSGLGKGIFASSPAKMPKDKGLTVAPIKLEGYHNLHSGTLNPYRQGQVL